MGLMILSLHNSLVLYPPILKSNFEKKKLQAILSNIVELGIKKWAKVKLPHHQEAKFHSIKRWLHACI